MFLLGLQHQTMPLADMAERKMLGAKDTYDDEGFQSFAD